MTCIALEQPEPGEESGRAAHPTLEDQQGEAFACRAALEDALYRALAGEP
jgi:hypothetical protein